MRISETTDQIVKDHCGISDNDPDKLALIGVYKSAAIAKICAYTALTREELDEHEDITYAFLAIVDEMFSVRSMTVEIDTINPMAAQILDSHRRNLL